MTDDDDNDTTAFLRIDALTKRFGSFTALKNISLRIEEGEFVCFLGPSGCGKTTLLRAIAGLDIQTSGAIHQAGRDISLLPPSQRDFGIVFQSYALFPNLTVERNVAYGLENQKKARDRIKARVSELLALVGLPDQGPKYPAQLSGGQQQRVALARALATSPGLLLLDEPLSALDARVRVHLRREIKALQDRLGVTTVMVTHDQAEALTMADRIVVMNQGVIEQIGTPTEIYATPANLFVADFIGEMNQLVGRATGNGRVAVGDMELACQAQTLAADTPVTVAVRPEDIVIGKAARGESDNSLDARIEEIEFLGSFWRVSLACEALDEARLRADIAANTAREMTLEPGAMLQAVLPGAHLRVYPQAA